MERLVWGMIDEIEGEIDLDFEMPTNDGMDDDTSARTAQETDAQVYWALMSLEV